MTNPFAEDAPTPRGQVPASVEERTAHLKTGGESLFLAPDGSPQEPSVEATALRDAGAVPYVPDVAAMLEQMKALQARVDAMQAERGIPSDPVEAAAKNLLAHVKARKAANPSFDFSELLEQLQYLADNTDYKPDDNAAQLVALAVDDAVSKGHAEFGYLTELARDFRKAVLKAGGASDRQAERTLRLA